jgi:hypothetical protein
MLGETLFHRAGKLDAGQGFGSANSSGLTRISPLQRGAKQYMDGCADG